MECFQTAHISLSHLLWHQNTIWPHIHKIKAQTLTRENNSISLHLQYFPRYLWTQVPCLMMFSQPPLRVIVQGTGGLLFNGVSIVHLAFIFYILCYDPACVQLSTASYDSIDPGSQYPACWVKVCLFSHKTVCNSEWEDTLKLYFSFSMVENRALRGLWSICIYIQYIRPDRDLLYVSNVTIKKNRINVWLMFALALDGAYSNWEEA